MRADFKSPRRWVLGGIGAGVGAAAAGRALAEPLTTSPRPLPRIAKAERNRPPDLAEVVEAARLTGQVGCVVADLQTGEILESYNPHAPMPPASVAKTLTTLYTLDTLGPGYKFTTRVIATGPMTDGIVQGDIVLAAGGDPSLSTVELGDLANKLQKAGVLGLTGKFLVSDAGIGRIAQIDPAQPAHVSYNPAVEGLNLNYNRVFFEWKREKGDYSTTMEARTVGYSPAVDIAYITVEDRSTPVYTYRSDGLRDAWTVARGALGKGGGRWLPVRQPALYAADVFRTLARANGLELPAVERLAGDLPDDGVVLADSISEPLNKTLKSMLLYSTNLTAEVLGLNSTLRRSRPIETLKHSASHMNEWLRYRMHATNPMMVDHSGLGGASRVTANDMVRVLTTGGLNGQLQPLLKSISMRDENYRVVKNHPARVVAKTGTLNFVSALAGYITAPDKRELVFAIFTADLDQRSELDRDERDSPEGGKAWLSRSRRLQATLLRRWANVYNA